MFRIAPLLLSLTLAMPALAATPIDQTRPLDPTGRVEIDNLKGRIQVRAWDRSEVKIAGTLGEGVEKLVVEGDRQHLLVRVQYPKGGGWKQEKTGPSDLQLTVPIRADLDVESVAADIDLAGVAPGSLSVDTVSGTVAVAAAPRKAKIDSVSGDLHVTVNSADVSVETVSGDVTLRGRMDGEIQGETVSGDIDVVVNGERVRELVTNTVSGNARIRTGLARNGEIRLTTVSGDLSLALPKDLSARVSAESFSGSLKAPNADIVRPKYGPGASFETRYGAGDGQIRLETFSGDAELRLE